MKRLHQKLNENADICCTRIKTRDNGGDLLQAGREPEAPVKGMPGLGCKIHEIIRASLRMELKLPHHTSWLASKVK